MVDITKALSAHFPPDVISWRVGSTTQDKAKGMALAYIDARDVMRRFDEVCGPFGWQNEHIVSPNGMVTCRIGVLSNDGSWIWKSDGAGQTDVEGEKGSYSDALKRSAVLWGVGRYLYDLDSPWVALEAHGRSYAIAKHELGKLRDLLYRINKTAAPPKKDDGPNPFEDERSPADDFYAQAKLTISNHTDPVALKAWVDDNLTHLNALPAEQGKLLRNQYELRMGALAQKPARVPNSVGNSSDIPF